MQKVLVLLFVILPLFGQEALALREAVERALDQNHGIVALRAKQQAAAQRTEAARSGYLPRVNYQEMIQRGNNPVYVFGALLTQRQFTERNFGINTLNRPDFLNNFQSMVTVDQVLFNAGRTRSAVEGAELGKAMTEQETRAAELMVMQRVLEAYFGTKLGEELVRAAEESVRSAEADLQRAEAFRGQGLTTDADVLSIRVHLAGVRQEAIARRTDLEVAKAALNVAMGAPEDAQFQLSTPLIETAYQAPELTANQNTAAEVRPELRLALQGIDAAKVQEKAARSAYWPEVFVRGVFETDRQEFLNKGGANWFFGGGFRWNLFNGFETRARVAEQRQQVSAAEANRRQAEAGVRFEVRQAQLRWNAVRERLALASASVAEAEESLRITRDRYENGLNTVTDLLRTETAVLTAKTGYLAALFEQRAAAARLEAAKGSLNPGSTLFD